MIYSFLHSFHETLQFKKLLNINIQSSNSWVSSNTWGSSDSFGSFKFILSFEMNIKFHQANKTHQSILKTSWKNPANILETSREHTLNLL